VRSSLTKGSVDHRVECCNRIADACRNTLGDFYASTRHEHGDINASIRHEYLVSLLLVFSFKTLKSGLWKILWRCRSRFVLMRT
jgi:hypothetical protein